MSQSRKGAARGTPSPSPSHWRTVYLLMAAVVGLLLMLEAAPRLESAFRRTPWDLNVDHLTARAYLRNYSPYTPEGAKRSGVDIAGLSGQGHPPTTSFWILPLAPLKLRNAGVVLGLMTLVLLFIEVAVSVRVLAMPTRTSVASPVAAVAVAVATAWLAVAYVAGCSFMDYHLGVGQLSGLIGFLYFVGWWAARSGRHVAAGAALGAACTLKLFPGLMIVFLLLSRRFKAVGAAVAVYLTIAAVMTARFGLGSWRRFFAVQPAIADQWMGNIQNQSIHGIVTHLFEPVCAPHGPVLPWAMRISALVSLALLGLATRWCWHLRRTSVGFDVAFALFVAISVLTSQWVWEHYTIIAVLPLIILTAELVRAWRMGRARWQVLALGTGVAGIVASWRVDIHLKQQLQRAVMAGDRAAHLRLHVLDIVNWLPGVVLVVALLVVCKWRHDETGGVQAQSGAEVQSEPDTQPQPQPQPCS